MTNKDAETAGDEAFARFENQLARLMARMDSATGHVADPSEPDPLESEIDPELERDIQLALLHYLAQRATPPTEAEVAHLSEDQRIQRVLGEHVKPLFDVIFATAHAHARAANEAIKMGRDPSARHASSDMTLDISHILEDDS
jgi:hypothetical protein